MSAERKLERRNAKPFRRKRRTTTSNKSGRSRLLGAMAKDGFDEYTKLKIVSHKDQKP